MDDWSAHNKSSDNFAFIPAGVVESSVLAIWFGTVSEIRLVPREQRYDLRKRDSPHAFLADTFFPMITGECDEQGPGKFCRSREEAEACNADQSICQSMGYWNF